MQIKVIRVFVRDNHEGAPTAAIDGDASSGYMNVSLSRPCDVASTLARYLNEAFNMRHYSEEKACEEVARVAAAFLTSAETHAGSPFQHVGCVTIGRGPYLRVVYSSMGSSLGISVPSTWEGEMATVRNLLRADFVGLSYATYDHLRQGVDRWIKQYITSETAPVFWHDATLVPAPMQKIENYTTRDLKAVTAAYMDPFEANKIAGTSAATGTDENSLTAAADRAFRFLASLDLHYHPIRDQKEYLEVVRQLQGALRPNER